jgi:hypothetical protein
MTPYLAKFTMINARLEDVLPRALEALQRKDSWVTGRFHGAKRTETGLYKVTQVGTLGPGLLPEEAHTYDRVSAYLSKDAREFNASVTRVPEGVVLTLAFESGRFLSQLGAGWLYGQLEAILSEFDVDASVFDYDEPPNPKLVEFEKLIQYLVGSVYGETRRPLVALVRTSRTTVETRDRILASGCKGGRMTSGYDLFTWLDDSGDEAR